MGVGTDGGGELAVVLAPAAADLELSARPVRRTFTAAEKLGILKEADQAASTGVICATGASLFRRYLMVMARSSSRRNAALEAVSPHSAA